MAIESDSEDDQKNVDGAQTAKESLRQNVLTAVVIGILGLLGVAIGHLIQGYYGLQQEMKRGESALILRAMETGNRIDSAHNLLFLKDLGLISDPKGTIESLRDNPDEAPFLPPNYPRGGGFDQPPTADAIDKYFRDYQTYRHRLAKLGYTPEQAAALMRLHEDSLGGPLPLVPIIRER